MNIDLSYAVSDDERNSGLSFKNPITTALRAIEAEGSLTAAAESLGISYRQLWNLIKKWEQLLNAELVVGGKGKKCVLSGYSQNLIKQENEILIRFAVPLSNLRAELIKAFGQDEYRKSGQIVFSGVADDAIRFLRDACLQNRLFIQLEFNSSREGVKSVLDGRSKAALFNYPLNDFRKSPIYLRLVDAVMAGRLKLITMFSRVQGLAVAPGNPLGLHSMIDVANRKARFVNRQEGTGTRAFLEDLLQAAELKPSDISGYEQTSVVSYRQIASLIYMGEADCGICLQNIAEEAGLGFIPLRRETNYLAIDTDFLKSPAGKKFMKSLRSRDWRVKASELPGYGFDQFCKEFSLQDLKPRG